MEAQLRMGRGKGRGRGGGGGGGGKGKKFKNGRGRGRGRSGRGEIGAGRGFEQQHGNEQQTLEIPEDEIDPLKLFVGNISQSVTKNELLRKLASRANVSSAVIVKKRFRRPKYGFVILPTEDDVKKIMDLNNQNFYLSGSKLVFRPARRRLVPPGEEGFIRQPLPGRDYDLSPLDPNESSIHILVDDVMMKILEYLPLKQRIHCEIICRRWQALLYLMFESSTHLNLSENYIDQNSLYISKPMLSKLLILKGENLKSLSLSETGVNLKRKLFLIIAQLCPNIEYLDLSNNQMLSFTNIKDLKDCIHLKCFSAKKCANFSDKPFKELISVLPCLEKIYANHTSINGDSFDLLPVGLKELNISFCTMVSKENLSKVCKVCKNLEVLEIEYLNTDKEFLEELGLNCTNLKSFQWSVRGLWSTLEVSNQVKNFTKLTSLKIVSSTFELPNIANSLKNLENLHIQIMNETKNIVDFGKFTKLKNVVLIASPFRKQELMSLEKCKKLQYVTIDRCEGANQNTIINIVKGCPEIKHIKCPTKESIDMRLLDDLYHIMKNRLEPIKISIKEGAFSKEWLKSQYDHMKIDFDFVEESLFDEDYDEDLDDDDDENLYDSDDMDPFWLNGYDSDDGLPDYMHYGDGLDLLNHFVFEVGLGLNHVGYDSDDSN